ncbi:unnamed protein product [Schistocephalus solidus]|uniref:Uncharacterized protein n=1 Tax=Schistocephalus solidus TaxID=70667 RepID=A0A183S9B5_SCHSO|nr:unnamed protein product [Schistocephalus solidus]
MYVKPIFRCILNLGQDTHLSKDFGCWLHRLKFHQDEVPPDNRSLTVLKHMVDEQLDTALETGLSCFTPFHVLCDQLQRLFQPPLSIEKALSQLLNRHLLATETPHQFADALIRLDRDAFPFLSAADQDQVILFHFKRGLCSQEVTFCLQIQPLNDAVVRASRMLQAKTLQLDAQPPKGIYRPSLRPRQ